MFPHEVLRLRLSRTTRGHGTEIQRHRGWRRKSSRNILQQVYESAPAECSLLHRHAEKSSNVEQRLVQLQLLLYYRNLTGRRTRPVTVN